MPKARHNKKAGLPVQGGIGESKSLPAVSPKMEDKTNPIASSQPCSVAYIRFGPEPVELIAPPPPSMSSLAVMDPPPGVARLSQDSRELLPVSLEGTQRSFASLSLGEMSAQD